jgi:hypothetical protein
MRRGIGASLLAFLAAAFLTAASPTLVLRMPGSHERKIAPDSLLGAERRDVQEEDGSGNMTVYHGMSLLDVLEKAGLETKSMPSGRKLAPAVVVAAARDGYTAVFSVGELLMHRADPRAFLVAETGSGPLPEDKGPIRLIVSGDRPRSAYGLASIELKALAENAPKR